MKVSAEKLKANCLKLIDSVASTREPVIITKHGKPVAMMIPAMPEPRTSLFGYMAGTAIVRGDIVTPVDEKWDVEGKARHSPRIMPNA